MVDDDGRTTTDGRRLDGYTISSPWEPNGPDELKWGVKWSTLHGHVSMFSFFIKHALSECTLVCKEMMLI